MQRWGIKRFSLRSSASCWGGCALVVGCVCGVSGGWNLWPQLKTFFDFAIWSWGKQSCMRWSVNVASADCSRLNLGAWGAWGIYLSNQLSWVTTWRFNSHTRLSCSSSRWVSPCVLNPLMIGLMVVLLTFFWDGEQGSIVLVPWELMLFWGIRVELKSKIMLSYSREVEWQQGINTWIKFSVYKVLAHTQNSCVNSAVINTQLSYYSCPWSFLGRSKYEMLFNVDIVNLL